MEYFGFMSFTDHLSTAVEGLDEYYHCRRTECGCITTNATWPNAVAAGGGQYWCPDPLLNCMYQYRAGATTHGGVELMMSKKVMVFQDIVREPGTLRYQYCEWGSAADETMKEDIKAIVHDMHDVIKEHGWMGAMRTAVELGKKQYHESWKFSEWGPERQAKLDGINMQGRNKKISAAHITEGFHYICKPQWAAGTLVMSQEDIMFQFEPMRIFTVRAGEGVPIHAQQGYAWIHAKLDKMKGAGWPLKLLRAPAPISKPVLEVLLDSHPWARRMGITGLASS